jgi:drug/metabolite transporter (DMT)-like permease
MTLFALALVLSSAFFHATWNLLTKRVGGGTVFIWLFAALAAAIYAPLAGAVIVLQQPRIGAVGLLFMAGSIVLHLAYFLLLGQGYRVGDLSVVYPLSRGIGPMLATAAAIAFFDERPSLLALSGALLVGLGVLLLAGSPSKIRESETAAAVAYAALIGVFIASYTLWDKHAVSALLIPPILYDWTNYLGRAVLLAPFALRRREEVRATWSAHRREALGAALLSPLSYILVLTALVVSPVSYVAPAREIGILIGAVMGARLLAEGDARRRLAAAGAIVLGVLALALG